MSIENQSLQQLLVERLTHFTDSEKPNAIIDAGIEKLFKDVVDSVFRSYGDFGKAVQDAVKAAMPANVSDAFELTRYNALIANSLRASWESSGVEGDMLRRANEALNAALNDEAIPARISLRELLELFISDHKDEAAQEGWERPEVRITESEHGGFSVFFDQKPESSYRNELYSRDRRHNFSLNNAIHVSTHGLESDEKGNQLCKVYSAKIDQNPIGKDFSITRRWERLIAGLYFGAALLIIDCEEDEFSYGLYD